jgi:D-alanyl-D-alanine carboxypeptidase/D-alanyl-D-alanine-endopeptidase (penicillin-binding protein 4)
MKFNQFSILNQKSRENAKLDAANPIARIARLFFAILMLANLYAACTFSKSHDPKSAGSPNDKTSDPLGLLKAKIDSLVNDSSLSSGFIGIELVSLDNGSSVYELNAKKLFHPASNMKILTTAAAETYLQGFNFVTPFITDGKIIGGALKGSIYIKGSGDPLLTRDDLDSVCAILHAKGIATIKGNLIGDVSAFDTISWGSGWMADDEPDSDEPYLTPLSIDENSIKVSVEPVAHRKQPHAEIERTSSFVSLTNRAVISEDTLIPALKIVRPHNANTFAAIGRFAPEKSTAEFEVSVVSPEKFFLRLLREKLKEHRILVNGRELIAAARKGDTLASIIHSIDSVITKTNKKSDNLCAENTLKTIGAKIIGGEGASKKGLTVVKEYLQTLGVDSTGIILADGSGVSFYNAISPDNLVRVLADRYRHKETFDKFYQSLPIAGIDGTLHGRMHDTPAQGNVHAKTGTITGVSTLSGYVTTRDGHLCAFSIMLNHFPGPAAKMRGAEDAILSEIAGSSLGALTVPKK